MTEDRSSNTAAARWIVALSLALPPLVGLAIYWSGLWGWFLADDFAWLGLHLEVTDLRSLLQAILIPTAHGTFRPLSERSFFLLFYELFGLNAFPYHLLIQLTYFATLGLLVSVLRRVTGSLLAGFLAALFWVVNPAMMMAMTWTSSYMHVLCPFFLLLALHFLLRHIETGQWRYYWAQMAVFLVGFGVMETNLVYPFLAAGYTWLRARRYFERTLPLFLTSFAFVVFHMSVAPKQQGSFYSLYFDSSMIETFWTYWRWAVFPLQAPEVWPLPEWGVAAGVALLTVALAAFLICQTSRRKLMAAYLLGWFVVLIGPMLPLRDHRQYYYLTLPLMGLSAFAGYAAARGWHAGSAWRVCAALLAGMYLVICAPVARKVTGQRQPVSLRAERMVRTVESVVRRRPDVTVLLSGVDNDVYWEAIWDKPFRLVGANRVYLTPGSEQAIQSRPGTDPIDGYVLPVIPRGKDLEKVAVLAVDQGMQDVTAEWVSAARAAGPPAPPKRLDVADPLVQSWLGEGWYPVEGPGRWMGKRASLEIAGPKGAGSKLDVSGYCVPDQVRQGPLHLSIAVDGIALGPAEIGVCGQPFHRSFALPAAVSGKATMQVTVEVDPAFRPANDPRELGAVFGAFEVKEP